MEPHRPNDDAPQRTDAWAGFRVDERDELLRLLKLLRDGSVPVALSSPRGHALSSQLWALDPVHEHLSFSAEGGGMALQGLAQCDEAVAVAYLDSVKLQFDLSELLLVHDRGSSALRSRMPAHLYRFQRRSAFRLRTLEQRAPQAQIRHPSMPDMQMALRVVDISANGCALRLPDDMPQLQPGTRLQGASIQLDADTRFTATLGLQHVSSLQPGMSGTRLGCEMLDLDGPAQRALQRYIDRTQQRRRALVRR
ncbi:MAG: flagellar regulator YcgR PilZN domain-containing protein [Rubrivivax sp.]